MADLRQIEARDRNAWRTWLQRNHAKSPGVQLVYYKKGTGHPSVSYAEAVEEALCFGWIDSRVNSIDDQRYMQVFTPRKPKSAWSALNKKRVAQLMRQGLMTDAGLDKVRQAKANGAWTTYDNVEKLTVPRDLAAALKSEPRALAAFNKLGPYHKRMALFWVTSVKKPETRARRIAKIVQRAIDGQLGKMNRKSPAKKA